MATSNLTQQAHNDYPELSPQDSYDEYRKTFLGNILDRYRDDEWNERFIAEFERQNIHWGFGHEVTEWVQNNTHFLLVTICKKGIPMGMKAKSLSYKYKSKFISVQYRKLTSKEKLEALNSGFQDVDIY